MATEFRSPDWDTYRMDYANPHVAVEPLADEVRIVGDALEAMVAEGILPHAEYDEERFLAHRAAVAESFEIPWTAITPRMQRALYAINAVLAPKVMIAAGIFCGNTFISNAGAGVGPGACYEASDLIGVEIVPAEAERAERNVRRIDPSGVARIVAADAVAFVREWPGEIGILYIDADGAGGRGKAIYADILEEALPKMPPGALSLAHNSVNCGSQLGEYFALVRESGRLRASLNLIIDGEGLEISLV